MTARHIPAIVITGELNEEKKEILDRLEAHFTKQGYTVGIVPDMAAMLLADHCGPGQMGEERFHEFVLQLTIDAERRVAGELSHKNKPLMFVCRGAMDGAAWLESELIEKIWDQEGHTRVDLRDMRYRGVLHIMARDPRVRSHDERTRDAWVGTSHLACVEHTLSMRERVSHAITWVTSFIRGIEHERRWIIHKPFPALLLPAHTQCIDIQQSYIRLPDEPKNHRIRRRGQNGIYAHWLTLKKKIGRMSSLDAGQLIDEAEYTSKKQTYADPTYAEVVKDRLCFVDGKIPLYWELDVFPDLPGFVLMEVETPRKKWPLELPLGLGPDDVTEVTGMPGYSNKDISKLIGEQRQAA